MQSEKKGNPNPSGTCSLRASAQELSRLLACVAGARSKWAQERTGAHEVSPSLARVFSCARLFPNACYAGYDFAPIFL